MYSILQVVHISKRISQQKMHLIMYFSIKLPKHIVIQKHNVSHKIVCNAETDRN